MIQRLGSEVPSVGCVGCVGCVGWEGCEGCDGWVGVVPEEFPPLPPPEAGTLIKYDITCKGDKWDTDLQEQNLEHFVSLPVGRVHGRSV